ncbi:MAG: PAS domain S-box protein [Deltaproteobacteria bacterium]|nr:PAS domain S-box protein [Deltaproteobacteria bacterium]
MSTSYISENFNFIENLSNLISDPVIIFDSTGEAIYKNKEAYRLFKELNSLSKLLDYYQSSLNLKQILDDCNTNNEVEWDLQNRYREEYSYHCRLSPLELNNFIGHFLLIQPTPFITTRENLRIKYHRFAQIVEQASNIIIATDLKGNIIYVNPSFEKTTGYTYDEVLGKNPNILQSGQLPTEFYKKLWNTITRGETWHGYLINKKKDGQIYHEDASIFPLKNEQGEITNYCAVKRDITIEKDLENQLAQIRKMETVSRLAGGLAHDFNNLLTAISGHAQLCKMELPSTSLLKYDVEAIIQAGNRAKKLVTQLLAIGKKQMIKPTVVNMNKIINDLYPMLHKMLPDNITLVRHLSPNIPYIEGDPGQLEQIMINLVMNARDALNKINFEKESKLTIIKTRHYPADFPDFEDKFVKYKTPYLVLSIQDNGPGINLQNKEKIFEPFFSTKDDQFSAGLGLSSVFGITLQNNAFIEIQTGTETGTNFDIFWPATNKTPSREHFIISTNIDIIGKETILFLENEDPVIDFACNSLRSLNYKVIKTSSPEEAAFIYKNNFNKIDLLITTENFQGNKEHNNAIDLLENLFIINPNLNYIITGNNKYPHHELSKLKKFNSQINFLNKPYTITELAKKIRKNCNNQKNIPSP